MTNDAMLNEFKALLLSYIQREAEVAEIAAWLAAVNWDKGELVDDEARLYSEFELLVTDITEDLRDEEDLREAARKVLSTLTTIDRVLYPSSNGITIGPGSSTTATVLASASMRVTPVPSSS